LDSDEAFTRLIRCFLLQPLATFIKGFTGLALLLAKDNGT
jgi:hypothetical protein